MLRGKNTLSTIPIITVLFAALTLLGNAAQKASVPKTPDKLTMGEDDVKHLLALMEADKNGKVSRQEYMKFMAAEFDRLDKSKTGELDVKVLTQSNLSATHFVGK
jgi:Ca2+-binding EF-hand superfamily protein